MTSRRRPTPVPAAHLPSPHTVAVLVLCAALTAGLSACNQQPGEARSNPTDSPSAPTLSGAPTSSPAQAVVTDAVPPPLDDNGPTDAGKAAKPDKDSATEARTRAVAFLRAFARTDLPQQQWWDGIVGFFTPTGAAAYQGTDVANVPVHQVSDTGAKVLPRSTRYRAQVKVRTDIGTYTVTLIRAEGAWLIDRATPPRSTGS